MGSQKHILLSIPKLNYTFQIYITGHFSFCLISYVAALDYLSLVPHPLGMEALGPWSPVCSGCHPGGGEYSTSSQLCPTSVDSCSDYLWLVPLSVVEFFFCIYHERTFSSLPCYGPVVCFNYFNDEAIIEIFSLWLSSMGVL